MGKGSRIKGCTFERLVAALILKAAGSGYGKKDCYRTPMSGGHPYAGESDLVISKKLQRLFPFCVECKHYKGWKVAQLFRLIPALVNSWITQVNTSSDKDKFKRMPVLVMRGNGTDIYCAAPLHAWFKWRKRLASPAIPGLLFEAGDEQLTIWKMIEWTHVKKTIEREAKRLKQA